MRRVSAELTPVPIRPVPSLSPASRSVSHRLSSLAAPASRLFVCFGILLPLLPMALLPAVPADAAVIRIPHDYPTIRQGIFAADEGDTVLVHPGIYSENLSFMGKDIVVGSLFIEGGDPGFIDLTMLRPEGVTPGIPIVSFTDEEGPGAVLTGFTIRDGSAVRGAGIYCERSFPSILHNSFISNHASLAGGGIFADYGGPTIAHCSFEMNSALEDGGGIATWASSIIVIHDNEFVNNTAGWRGGAIFVEHSVTEITDNVIRGNMCGDYYAGGIANRNSASTITGNLILDNGGGAFAGGLFY